MTRRVRFTPWSCSRTFVRAGVVACSLLGAGQASATDARVPNRRPLGSSIHRNACFVRQADIATAPNSNSIFTALAAADVDGDGDADALSFQDDNRLSWHENVLGDGSSWVTRTVAASTGRLYSIVPIDTDGDGDLDVVSHPGQVLTRFDNAAGNGTVWSPSTVTFLPFSRSTIDDVDVDGDGDLDLLVPDGSYFGGSGVSWFEDTGAPGAWPHHLVSSTLGAWAAGVDVDGDGDQDVVAEDYSLALSWYENLGGSAPSWMPHPIGSPGSTIFQPRPVDIDGDGDPDLWRSIDGTTLGWFENVGNGSSWAVRTVQTQTTFVSAWTDSGDLDADGDTDALAYQLGPDALLWYENMGGGSAWVPHVAATQAADAITVARITDLDSDGRPDILHGRPFQSTVGWSRNEGGQVVLDLLDQVPSTVANGDVFPILRLTVTHAGRAGDPDLELARLGLLFEEEAGDPLTSAEANALVEELRIYRDENGNGVFEPGTDTLVATVPTLALTNGVQTVTFTDADPNVQVAFGAPRTFFVVAQLTADASQQVPHQFRLSHLATGPSATVAEDRSNDIPLTIACPADFPSRLVIATPVELMGFSVE